MKSCGEPFWVDRKEVIIKTDLHREILTGGKYADTQAEHRESQVDSEMRITEHRRTHQPASHTISCQPPSKTSSYLPENRSPSPASVLIF